MAIADQIAELTTIRGDIRTALTNKGVSASSHNFADFPNDVENIPSGGGGGLPIMVDMLTISMAVGGN